MDNEGVDIAVPLSPLQKGALRSWTVGKSPVHGWGQAITRQARRPDVARTRDAWEKTLRRFPTLRAILISQNVSEPLQVSLKKAVAGFEAKDLRDLSAAERDASWNRVIKEERDRGFDLARPPLIRLAVVALGDELQGFVWTYSTILLDRSSVRLAVSFFFRTLESDVEITVDAAADLAAYQNETLAWLGSLDSAAAARYWGSMGGNKFPASDTGHNSGPQSELHTCRISLSQSLTKDLDLAIRSYGVSWRTLVLGAWAAVWRYWRTGSSFLVGIEFDGRPSERPGADNWLGLFANVLPVPVDFSEDAPVWKWLVELEDKLSKLADCSLVSHDELRTAADWPADAELFDSCARLDRVDGSKAGDDEWKLEFRERPAAGMVVSAVLGAELLLAITGDMARHERGLIESVARQLEHWLAELVRQSEPALGEISGLSREESTRVLEEWNETHLATSGETLHVAFARQAQLTPDAIAVTCGAMQLSYQALNSRANALAHHLIGMGVGADVMVGVCLDRTLDLVTAVLAVLKAGGAFVPLDPDYPTKRLEFMIEDLRAPVLLCQEKLVDSLPTSWSQVLVLDQDTSWLSGGRTDNPETPVHPEQLAYAIYTSGSTGTPKAVMIPHRGLANLIAAQRNRFGPQDGRRALQFATISFDASVWELALAFGSGAATLCLGSREELSPGADLSGYLNRYAVSLATLPPSSLAVTPAGTYPQLVDLIVAGEACGSSLVTDWGVGRRFFNAYGPTETTVCSTMVECDETGENPSIGRPIANTATYILGAYLEPVPIGAVGELYVGGECLARGYLEREGQTAERFVPNPFSSQPGSRLYRTGDLARHRVDGEIEFIGRRDHQVKLRGFRIETGEIESALREHRDVLEAVVVQRGERGENTHLAAYVTTRRSASTESGREQSRHVAQWRGLYNQLYGTNEEAEGGDRTFDIVGWTSSYTGEPIPAREMRESVERTVERILALRPRRVLEIGCGTGLLLARIAPECESYVGTDFAAEVIPGLEELIASRVDLKHARVSQCPAEDLGRFADEEFDLILLNSVVQYFPGADYLAEVVTNAAALLGDAGRIFIGDVRNFELIRPFHASVQLHRVPTETPLKALRQGLTAALEQEEELLLSPRYFHALARQVPGVDSVTVEAKRGVYGNELIRYRYDVILTMGEEDEPALPETQARVSSLDEVRAQLASEDRCVRLFPRLPNARLEKDVELARRLERSNGHGVVRTLREELGRLRIQGFDPEELYALGEQLGYRVATSWSQSGGDGSFDAVFVPADRTDNPARCFPSPEADEELAAYANNPIQRKLNRSLAPELLEFVRARLPVHMVPASLIPLDQMPLTPNGKIDRERLPVMEAPVERDEDFIPPTNEMERRVAAIWKDALGCQRVGAHDNFFELGGHSLLAAQVAPQLEEALGVEVSLRMLVEHTTVADLCHHIGELQSLREGLAEGGDGTEELVHLEI